MLTVSYLLENFIISNLSIHSCNDDGIISHNYFNSPDIAINNAVSTPQLQPTDVISSSDYSETNSRAKYGFSPYYINDNFKTRYD